MPFAVKKIKGIDTSSLERLGGSVVDLAKYTEDEFSQVASALQGTDPEPIWNVPLPKPRRGTVVYADGTHWNPGNGEGPYWFDGTLYHPMGQNVVAPIAPSPIHASLGADVLLNNTANYFDGPSIAQGTVGTWFVSGLVTVQDTGSQAQIRAKLWDGTTVIASGVVTTPVALGVGVIALSGYIVGPAANLKISVKDVTATTGKILFNQSGESKDSTISAYRIA